MSRKIKIQEIDNRLRIENFHKRWNIQLCDAERWENFRNRALNSYAFAIGRIIKSNDYCEDEFFDLIGIHIRRVDGIISMDMFDNQIKSSPTYKYFANTNDIKKFILGLEVISWMEELDDDDKTHFFESIQNDIITTGVPLEFKQTKNGVLFYPAGAKLLDEKLVNDNLEWLSQYPKSYDAFKESLQEYGVKGKERDVVDKLRLSLELLLKSVLSNKKSLENQKTELGKYFKNLNISSEVSNLYMLILDKYSTYQNNNAKHDSTVPEKEVELMLYLTGTLIRFLMTSTTK